MRKRTIHDKITELEFLSQNLAHFRQRRPLLEELYTLIFAASVLRIRHLK